MKSLYMRTDLKYVIPAEIVHHLDNHNTLVFDLFPSNIENENDTANRNPLRMIPMDGDVL